MMKSISVPDYFADEFNQPLGHASKHPDALAISIKRIFLLVEHALKNVEWPDWEINDGRIKSKNDIEPYGIEFIDDKFYIYSKERGSRGAIAIFKNGHMAAEYFVWLVSKGNESIDWTQLLEMLP